MGVFGWKEIKEKERERFGRRKFFFWIVKWERRDLKGRELKGFYGYFIWRFQSVQSWKDLKGYNSQLPSISFHFLLYKQKLFLFLSFPSLLFPFPPFLFYITPHLQDSIFVDTYVCDNNGLLTCDEYKKFRILQKFDCNTFVIWKLDIDKVIANFLLVIFSPQIFLCLRYENSQRDKINHIKYLVQSG